jgi:hypothetical protein
MAKQNKRKVCYMSVAHFVNPFIHSQTLGLCPPFDCGDNVAVNTGVDISVEVPAFSPFGYALRSGIAGPCL